MSNGAAKITLNETDQAGAMEAVDAIKRVGGTEITLRQLQANSYTGAEVESWEVSAWLYGVEVVTET